MKKAVVAALVLWGCGSANGVTLESLAIQWSGGRRDPACQSLGPRGEYLGNDLPGTRYCQWPTISRGAERGTVGAYRDSVVGYRLVIWERVFTSETGLHRLRDSLSQSFRKRGFRERSGAMEGWRWESDNIGVEWGRTMSQPGIHAVVITGTILPKQVSSLVCAPKAPGATN